MSKRRTAWLSMTLGALLCLSCEQSPLGAAAGAAPLFAFGVTSKPTAAPTPTPRPSATPAPATVAVPTPTATPRRSSGGGGSSRQAPAPTPTPTATPTPAPPLAPGASGTTIGDPADRLKIDGFRFDPDFDDNGKVHLAFSVFGADGTDMTEQMDPAGLSAVMAFSAEERTLLAFEEISVVVEGLKAVGRPPLDVVLDLDSTGSMAETDPERLRVNGAKGYIDAMRPEDQVAVMDFSTMIPPGVSVPLVNFLNSRMLHPFSKDRDAARAAVDEVIQMGNTNLYDSMAEAITYLASQQGNRPKALVVLTDGQDNSSMRTIQDVVTQAKANNVLLMLLAFADYSQAAMHGLVSDSGGYFVGAEDASQLEAQYTAAVRTVNGNAQAIIYVPEDQRIARHMAGRLTARIDGQDYSGSFNMSQP